MIILPTLLTYLDLLQLTHLLYMIDYPYVFWGKQRESVILIDCFILKDHAHMGSLKSGRVWSDIDSLLRNYQVIAYSRYVWL